LSEERKENFPLSALDDAMSSFQHRKPSQCNQALQTREVGAERAVKNARATHTRTRITAPSFVFSEPSLRN
jgi:hypothetical protein